MLKVLYLVHDLADPAVRRRVMTLQAGGASVTLAGFRRGSEGPAMVEGMWPLELGTTRDADFSQRVTAVAKAVTRLGRLLRSAPVPDVIIARNLETLPLANRARRIFGRDIPVAYECLDIHRLLLRRDGVGSAFRLAERLLGRHAKLLLTSSPAFIEHYFKPHSGLDLPVVLLENRVIDLGDANQPLEIKARVPALGEPWKIGWFGALRCRTSLRVLAAFSRRMEGRFEIVLRGRPAHGEFDDFEGFVAAEPFVTFHGPYRNPEDLAAIYGEVHFNWAVDCFEAGQNSDWLLPNRLYEGGLFGALPIALQGTETARFLADRNAGMILDSVTDESLASLMSGLDTESYLRQFGQITALDRKTWVMDRDDCRDLVRRLANLSREPETDTAHYPFVQPQSNKGGWS